MCDGLDWFGISDIEFGVLKWGSVILDVLTLDVATGRGVPEPGGFSLGEVVPSDTGVEKPVPESVYCFLHVYLSLVYYKKLSNLFIQTLYFLLS